MSNRLHQPDLRFDERFLEQYTGRALLTDPVGAIVELVANAWDAGASSVTIDWPIIAGQSLRVADNGEGMTEDEFTNRWLTLSYNRLKEQGAFTDVFGNTGQRRRVFGQNGIGRFAAFCFGSEYHVTTTKGGTYVTYSVSRGVEKPIALTRIADGPADGSGTIIEVSRSSGTQLAEPTIRAELGKRFLTDPLFDVSVNGVRVDFEDIGGKGVQDFQVDVPDIGSIRVLMIDAERTDRTTKQHGVAWHVNGRLVGDCGWHGNGVDDLVDGRRIEARRYTFIIFADSLAQPGAVKPDWRGFDEDNEAYKKVREAVVPALRDRLLGLTTERRKETTNEVRRANAAQLINLTPLSREKWNQFVDQAQETCPSLSQQELQILGGVLANLEISHSQYGLLKKLHDLKPNELDDLHKILQDWTVDTAKAVLDELQVRLKLVDELNKKTSSEATLEVQELQPLFHRGLWIFGPEFETIEFTSNEGMTRVIQKLFGSEEQGTTRRPDFAILPDSSVGLYSYPKYDEYGAEIHVDRLVIIELKKPGVRVSEDQKSQCWKYVKELYEKGLLAEATRVDCYVLGSVIDQNEREPRTEKNEKVRIIPLDFGVVLTRAKSRLLKLYDRVRSAPFLQEHGIDDFLSGDSLIGQTELRLSEDQQFGGAMRVTQETVVPGA